MFFLAGVDVLRGLHLGRFGGERDAGFGFLRFFGHDERPRGPDDPSRLVVFVYWAATLESHAAYHDGDQGRCGMDK